MKDFHVDEVLIGSVTGAMNLREDVPADEAKDWLKTESKSVVPKAFD